jgi:hypothetical protein
MPITNTRSHADDRAGWPPDKDPVIVQAVMDAWAHAYVDEGSDAKTMREGLYLRASDAGACARALGYRIRRRMDDTAAPLSDPPTVADQYRMNTGTLMHEKLGPYLKAAYPGAEVEVLTIREDEPQISMHVDAVIRQPLTTDPGNGKKDHVTIVEIKTINGMGFKRMVGALKKGEPAEGPRWNAVVQGALAAYEHDADHLVIMVFALELISKSVAARYDVDELGQMAAQWTLTRDEWEPIAMREQGRMLAALRIVQDGGLPPRSIPDNELPKGNRITNPLTGEWVLEDQAGNVINLGNTWHCDYCWDRGNCVKDGPS